MVLSDVIVTYLELTKGDFTGRRSDRCDVSFSHVDPPIPELNRFFYMAVGGRWYWLDKRSWTAQQWADRLANKDRIETWILACRGVPAGYVELERQGPDQVEIAYLGLLPGFIGGGLGAHLLTCACERAFAMGAATVLVNTCSLDHPQALANYQARGFKPVRTKIRRKELPPSPPGAWD